MHAERHAKIQKHSGKIHVSGVDARQPGRIDIDDKGKMQLNLPKLEANLQEVLPYSLSPHREWPKGPHRVFTCPFMRTAWLARMWCQTFRASYYKLTCTSVLASSSNRAHAVACSVVSYPASKKMPALTAMVVGWIGLPSLWLTKRLKQAQRLVSLSGWGPLFMILSAMSSSLCSIDCHDSYLFWLLGMLYERCHENAITAGMELSLQLHWAMLNPYINAFKCCWCLCMKVQCITQ